MNRSLLQYRELATSHTHHRATDGNSIRLESVLWGHCHARQLLFAYHANQQLTYHAIFLPMATMIFQLINLFPT